MTPNDNVDLDIEERRLCSDGACIGVLDASGRCKVCGLVDRSAPEAAASPLTTAASAATVAPLEESGPPQAEEATGSGVWDRRELCPDGACVGVLGNDGHCRICGRSR